VKPIALFLLAVVLTALQAALLRFVGGGVFSLALPLALVVYLGLWSGTVDGALGSAAIGYVLDLSAGNPKGLMTFLAVALFLFCRVAGAGVDVRGRLGYALLTFVGTVVFGLGAILLLRSISPEEAAPGGALVGRLLVEGLLTAAASPLVLAVMRRIDALFTKEEPGLLR
jgi:hypothetical protein